MILAHLPAGYLQYRALGSTGKVALCACLLGSVAPDFDMFWFHLVDSTTHHHRFWPHIPAVWLGMLVVAWVAHRVTAAGWAWWLTLFAGAGLGHMVLDTLAGGIMWLWPLNDHLFTLVTVPATQAHWVLSFMLHWTFLAEIAILLFAAWLLFFRRRPL